MSASRAPTTAHPTPIPAAAPVGTLPEVEGAPGVIVLPGDAAPVFRTTEEVLVEEGLVIETPAVAVPALDAGFVVVAFVSTVEDDGNASGPPLGDILTDELVLVVRGAAPWTLPLILDQKNLEV
jgi:hypothetical protein